VLQVNLLQKRIGRGATGTALRGKQLHKDDRGRLYGCRVSRSCGLQMRLSNQKGTRQQKQRAKSHKNTFNLVALI